MESMYLGMGISTLPSTASLLMHQTVAMVAIFRFPDGCLTRLKVLHSPTTPGLYDHLSKAGHRLRGCLFHRAATLRLKYR